MTATTTTTATPTTTPTGALDRAALVALAADLADRFAPRAAQHDRDNTFPFENFRELHEAGYLALTVPQAYGGGGISSLDLVFAQERLAQGDGSTALAASMHLALVGRLATTRLWPEPLFATVCREIVERGALVNSANSEPDLGSPSRGALPSTTATRTEGGWLLNGRKRWVSLAPALTWAQVLATAVEVGQERRRANFVTRVDAPGIRIEETWDNHGMRATASHDLVLENVFVPAGALVPDAGSVVPGDGREWGPLATSAVFLGVATAARNEAARFARQRRPNGMAGPIAELPAIQQRMGELELLLLQARTLLYDTAERWQRFPAERDALAWRLAAAKYTVSNNTIRAGELAVRVTGSAGLARSSPLERYLRDLRVSIGQPPIDDAALATIGRAALGLT